MFLCDRIPLAIVSTSNVGMLRMSSKKCVAVTVKIESWSGGSFTILCLSVCRVLADRRCRFTKTRRLRSQTAEQRGTNNHGKWSVGASVWVLKRVKVLEASVASQRLSFGLHDFLCCPALRPAMRLRLLTPFLLISSFQLLHRKSESLLQLLVMK